MFDNPVKPHAQKIPDVLPKPEMEWTFRVANDIPVRHGQFISSLPMVGEAPISISGFGDVYVDFTIRKMGKATDGLFNLKKSDSIFLRGCYGNGWPVEQLKGKNIVIVVGGTGVSPVKSLIHMLYENPDYAKEIHLIFGFKNSRSILFADELAEWKSAKHFHVVYTLGSEECAGWNKGLVTDFLKTVPFNSFGGNYTCIVVVPPVMMKFSGLSLLTNGVPENKIWMSFEWKCPAPSSRSLASPWVTT